MRGAVPYPRNQAYSKWEKAFGLSLTVSVDTVSSEELDEFVEKGEYQIAFTKLSAKDGNVLSFLDTFTSESSFNYANYQSEAYDALIADCKNKFGGDTLVSKFSECEHMLINEGVFYPVYRADNYAYFSQDVEGVFGLPGFTCIDFAGWGY